MQNDLISTLIRLRKHPAYGSAEFAMNLDGIASFINGYEMALLVHEIEEVGSTFNSEFTAYLKKKYTINSELDWVSVLRNISADSKKELSLFFLLLEEFSKKN